MVIKTSLLLLFTLVIVSQSYASTATDKENNVGMRRVVRESARIYPPRVGRNDPEIRNKRAADLSSFPRVGRTNLQLFPRLGRTPSSLTKFPRVGRTAWCNDRDCSDISDDALRQLVRRMIMPPRIGRSEKVQQFMMARPRIGKRVEEKRQRMQGLSVFPRVGRGDVDEEDPSWFAEPAKRKEGADSNLWFGPRLGRKKRDVQEQTDSSQDAAALYPVYQLLLTEPYNSESDPEKDTSQEQPRTQETDDSWSTITQ